MRGATDARMSLMHDARIPSTRTLGTRMAHRAGEQRAHSTREQRENARKERG